MSITMYKASVPLFVQYLNGLSAVLDKAAAFAEARKIDQSVLLGLRLYPDMLPFAAQVRQTGGHAIRACSEAAGVPAPQFTDSETTLAELKDRIAKTIDFLKTIKPEQMNGTEDKEITLKFGPREVKFTGLSLLQNFSVPNFYFHATTAYDILRHCGVEIGKRDFMSTPVEL